MGVSGNSAMKFAPLYVLLWAAPNLVDAQSEVICPEGKFKTTKPLGLDEYVDYKTQDGAPGTDYTNGVNCNVLFKRKKGSDCELKFNCTHFDLKSAKPAPKCQDKIIISKKKYCQTTGPDVTVSGSKLKVAFKTNKKGTATGAVCTAYCVPPPPPPASSTPQCQFSPDCKDVQFCQFLADAVCVCKFGQCHIEGQYWGPSPPQPQCETWGDCNCSADPSLCYCHNNQCREDRWECHGTQDCNDMDKCN